MKFKKLSVMGFKSFADKLEIKFGDGITAIVGPNGCGKSNVADAVRWVLGEQSAKLLRGSTMQDIIFNGTDKRKSLSYAEVSLVFDNKNRALFPSYEYEEIVISRKLYRSGESEYFMNRAQCRLKDISELLRDGAFGREGYTIIGQGKIDELLMSKPENRRAIFEEAAGITKFKAKKEDAERKLARTDDNLLRINDILEEKSKQLEPVSRQAEAARKWLDLREKLKFHEINAYITQYDSASLIKQALTDKLELINNQLEQKQEQSRAATESYAKTMNDLSGVDADLERFRDELLTLTVGAEKQAGQANLLKERLGFYNRQNEEITLENDRLNAEFKHSTKQIEELEAKRTAAAASLSEDQSKFDLVSAKYINAAESVTVFEEEMDRNNRELLEAMDKLSDIKSNMSALTAEREAINGHLENINRRIEECAQKSTELTEQSEKENAELVALAHDKHEIELELEDITEKSLDTEKRLNVCSAELEELNRAFYTARSRKKLLSEMHSAFEGYANSVKNLLHDANTNTNIKNLIEGVVAQLIKVPKEFETAIEMALGSAVSFIVTRNENDAQRLIEYLKQKNYGRATFLPMTSVKPRTVDERLLPLLKEEGCFGKGEDLVSFDPKYGMIVKALLGSTVIVSNLDAAIRLAKKSNYAFRIVTLEGDIIYPHGSMTGGSKKLDIANIFTHERELNELTQLVEQQQSRTEKLGALKRDLGELLDRQESASKELDVRIHDLAVKLAAKNETLTAIEENILRLKREQFLNEEEKRINEQRLSEISSQLDSVGELENTVSVKKREAADLGAERAQEFDLLRARRDDFRDKMTNLRLIIVEQNKDIATLDSDIKRLKAHVLQMTELIEQNNTRLFSNNREITKFENQLKELTAIVSSGAQSERIKQLTERLSDMGAYKQKIQDDLAVYDRRRLELVDEVQDLSKDKFEQELKLSKVDSDIEVAQQRIEEEYSLSYDQCLQYKSDEEYDLEKGAVEIQRLKRQMSNLGNINVDAIEYCKELYAKYYELDKQRQDLCMAKVDLEKLIKQLSDEMLKTFNSEFEKIRANFKQTFKELFNGGSADLILCENENPLAAGVEIIAQPPEKKLQSISLLSGGEKALTAISILFAILRLKPMPFCMLDEIEAPLDDANAARFAAFLKRFSQDTQFIVITHRKPTMEQADSIYGVTMEEKGVSKIVSVRLEDAAELEAV